MSASRWHAGRGGLPQRRLEAGGAHADICAHGAQLLAWQPAGEADSRLYLSPLAEFRSGAAIRGGVPVIFPQFAGEGPLPKHGFARTALWTPLPEEDSDSRTVLRLARGAATHALWPHAYVAELRVELERRALLIELCVRNTGTEAFAFTAALHSYFAVDDSAAATVHGLDGLRYRDSAGGNRLVDERADAVRFDGEVDRIYFGVPGPVELREPRRRLRIASPGFADCVVWNPGAHKAAALADLAPADYRRFVCIEAAAIGTPLRLEPGQSWRGAQRLEAV